MMSSSVDDADVLSPATRAAIQDAARLLGNTASNVDSSQKQNNSDGLLKVVPTERLYKLLLKNVSRDDPLSQDELSELKAFRAQLSAEQWKELLQFARSERKKRDKRKRELQAAQELLAAPSSEEYRPDDVTTNATAAVADAPRIPAVTRHLPQPQLSADIINDTPQRGSPHRVNDDTASTIRPIDSSMGHSISMISIPQPTPERVMFKNEHDDSSEVDLSSRASIASVKAAPYSPAPAAQTAVHSSPSLGAHSSRVDAVPPNSLEVSLRKGRLGKRPRVPSNTNFPSAAELDRSQVQKVAKPFASSSSPSPSPAASIRFGTPLASSSPHKPMPAPESSSSYRNSSKSSSENRGEVGRHHSPNSSEQQQQQQQRPETEQQVGDDRVRVAPQDLQMTVDLARNSLLRLESAYNAAKCLSASFTADRQQLDGSNYQKVQATRMDTSLSILMEMMVSLEKAKGSLLLLLDQEHLPKEAATTAISPGSIVTSANAATYSVDADRTPHPKPPLQYQPASSITNSNNNKPIYQQQPQLQQQRQYFFGDDDAVETLSPQPVHEFEHAGYQQYEVGPADHAAQFEPYAVSGPVEDLLHIDDLTINRDDFEPWQGSTAMGSLTSTQQRAFGYTPLNTGLEDVQSTIYNRQQLQHQNKLQRSPRGTSRVPTVQYNSEGYMWEGVRCERAQGQVARVCIAQGPLAKALEDFPIRTDVETGTVDVVWREFRSSQDLKDLERYNNGSGLDNLNYSNYYTRTSDKENALLLSKYKNGRIPSPVLRRERFEFDDIFAGVSAPGRMSLYVRQRTRKALEYARGLTLLCLGCGYILSGQLEPPLALLLGNGGGTGLIHSAVEEIFRYIHPSVTYTTEQVRHGSFATGADRMRDTSPQYMSAAGNSAMRSLAVKVAYEQMNTKVVLTAVIITEDGMIIDLLSKSGVREQEQSGPILRKRKSDRTPVLCNVSRLELKSAMDFDRVSGMLLGKRATIESMRAARLKEAEYGGNFLVARKRNGVSDGEGSTSRFSALHPWVQVDGLADEPLSRSPGRLRGQLSGIGDSGVTETSGQQAATMLFTISVSGGGISKGLNVADFHFVSPCGSCWHTPGTDVNVLSEIISSLPHAAPPSLLRCSPLATLLMPSPNEAATNMDYLNIMTIHRPTDDELKQMQAALVRKQKQKIKAVTGKEPGTPVAAKAKPPSYEVQPALSSLRVIGKIL